MTDLTNPNLTALQRRDAAHHAIETERDFQDRAYPKASSIYEYSRLCQKYVDRILSPDFGGDVRAEFRKLAATAKRCLELHGSIARVIPPTATRVDPPAAKPLQDYHQSTGSLGDAGRTPPDDGVRIPEGSDH